MRRMRKGVILSLAALFGCGNIMIAQELNDAVVEETVIEADGNQVIDVVEDSVVAPIVQEETEVKKEIAKNDYLDNLPDSLIKVDKPDPMELEPEESLWEPRFPKVEAHIGVNLANYSSDYKSTGIKPGLNVGIGFDFPFKHHYSINPELNFTMVGAKVDYTDKVSGKERLNYLEIPLYSKWEFGRKKVKPFVALAPTLGIGFAGTRIYDDKVLYTNPRTNPHTKKHDKEDSRVPLFAPNEDVEFEEAVYKKMDFGFKFKVGVTHINGFMAQAGFQLGLVDLARDDFYKMYGKKIYGSKDTIGVKNQCIFISVGYCW